MIQDKAYDEIDRMWQRKEIENKEKSLDQMFRSLSEEYQHKRDYIRRYDNEKIGIENWYGMQDYRQLNFDAVDARLKEIVLEKAHGQG